MYLNGICFITDRRHCGISLFEAVSDVLNAGIKFIQYREKDRTRRQIYEEALRLRRLTSDFSAALIINDHADIALAVEAEGVHLGQADFPLKEARRIMGGKIVGISTHNLEQAIAAEADGADYIGFGPIFHTTTKDAGIPVGVNNLRIIKQNVSIPVIAIGGINLDNIESVINAGADAAAIAAAICKGDLAENARRFVSFSWG